MARYTNGWVKAHRKIEKNWISQNLIAEGLWNKLLRFANYEPSKVLHKGEFITLERGQILTTIKELIGKTDCNRSVVERLLNLFIEDGMIQQSNSNEGRIITICNYSLYQDSENDEQHSNNNETTTKQQRNNNETTHRKKSNNNKKKRILLPSVISDGGEPPSPNVKYRDFIARYSEAYKAKYASNPVIDGKATGIVKRLVDALGLGPAVTLVEAYLQMNDQWFITKSHDLTSFEQNLNKIKVFIETGARISQQDARKADIIDQNQEAIDYMAQRLREERVK